MCVSPITVKNPYHRSGSAYYFEGKAYHLGRRYVSQQPYIQVPCGKCADCRDSYVMSIVQRAQMESFTSYVYMVTLTYDDNYLPSLQFTTSYKSSKSRFVVENSNCSIYYADISHVQALMKRLRNHRIFSDRDFRYLLCTEYGTEGYRPHFHILFFVGKRKDDSPDFAINFESQLKWAIFCNYGDNIGTRKHPFYRPYFQYRVRHYKGKIYSTYTCKLVRDYKKEPNDILSYNSLDSVNASIHYLVSYINKPSRYDELVSEFSTNIQNVLDKELSRKVCLLLKSRCIYSKGFGWGFDTEGRKIFPSLRFKPVTLYTAYLSDQMNDVYPKTFDEFAEQEPARAREVRALASRLFHMRKDLSHLTVSEWISRNIVDNLNFYLFARYFPGILQSWIYASHFQQSSYDRKLLPKNPYDESYKDSFVFARLREAIDSVPSDVPFIPFRYYDRGGFKYVPLCSYYKRYVCSLNDYDGLFYRCKVVDKDEYLSKFERNEALSLRRELKQINNQVKHENIKQDDFYHVPRSKNNFLSFAKRNNISIFAPTLNTLEQLLEKIGLK